VVVDLVEVVGGEIISHSEKAFKTLYDCSTHLLLIFSLGSALDLYDDNCWSLKV